MNEIEIKEAIEYFKNKSYEEGGMRFTAVKTAIKALEKQMPKKPYIYEYEISNGGFLGIGYQNICNYCKKPLDELKYCPHCGQKQKLDWSEVEDEIDTP